MIRTFRLYRMTRMNKIAVAEAKEKLKSAIGHDYRSCPATLIPTA